MTNRNQPEPCNPEIFKSGKGLCALDASSWQAEEWVHKVAKLSGQQVDWHYSGGIANVLYIGDYEKAMAAVIVLEPDLDGRILRKFAKEVHGLYRKGDVLPEGTLAVSTIEQLIDK